MANFEAKKVNVLLMSLTSVFNKRCFKLRNPGAFNEKAPPSLSVTRVFNMYVEIQATKANYSSNTSTTAPGKAEPSLLTNVFTLDSDCIWQ